MVELSLVASAALPSVFIHQERQGFYKAPKELQTLLPLYRRKQDTIRSGSVQFNTQHLDLGQPMHLLLENNQSARLSPVIEPLLFDMQDSCSDLVLFSFGIAEKCMRNEKILKSLMSESEFAQGESLDVSLLSEVTGFHDATIGMLPSHRVLVDDKFSVYKAEMDYCEHPFQIQNQIYAPEPLLDFVGNSSGTSYFTVHPDGRLLFAGSATQMEDLLLVVAEFNVPKRSTIGSKLSLLLPYFTRKARGRSQAHKVSSPAVAPLKSPADTKQKRLPKEKKNKRLGRQQNLYQRNYFHACESLLSVVLDKEGCTTIRRLKKSGSEISRLLTQFSAGIAGTGLAVIFSALCKLACGMVPLCATRLLNTGFGFGLFWLSWAINGLRDTVINISKSSGHMNLKEEEIVGRVRKSMNEILFRAATLLAVAVLRFA